MESIVKRGRDTTNIRKRFHITTLKNAQGIGKINSFLVDGTKIQESRVGTNVKKLVTRIEIQDSQARIKNYEEWNKIEIHNIGTRIEIHEVQRTKNLWPTKILCPKTKIRNWEQRTNFFDLRPLSGFLGLANLSQLHLLTVLKILNQGIMVKFWI